MKIENKNILRCLIGLIIVSFLMMGVFGIEGFAESETKDKKKVITFIMDEMSLEEMLEGDTPHLDKLIDKGAIGFMNTRAKIANGDKGSRYLSLGMGVRTRASLKGGWAFNRDEENTLVRYDIADVGASPSDLYKLNLGVYPPEGEIINLALGDINKIALANTPNNEIGHLGRLARENGLTIGLVGNSDSDVLGRQASMLAMDEKGIIPLGYLGSDLLYKDKAVLGNRMINSDRMLEEIDRIYDETDILFIDYGDTVRVEKSGDLALEEVKMKQKIEAIERGDEFIGRMMSKFDLEDSLFVVISPTPSRDSLKEGNFGLSPIIISGKGMGKGLLTSNTTRREGLVSNFDFGPTLLRYFDEDMEMDFIGESMSSIGNDEPREVLSKNYSDYIYMRNYRNVFHRGFIILIIITLLLLYIPRFTSWKGIPEYISKHLGMTVPAVPLMMMAMSMFNYTNIILDMIVVFLGAFLIGFTLNKIFKDPLKTVMSISLSTVVILLIDSFIIKDLMMVSPLGSDAIAGGRFYGIGNDYMGILLGSILLSLFIIYEKYDVNRNTMLGILGITLGITVVALSPFVGANMGGTLTTMIILIMTVILMLDRKITFKKLSILMTGVVIGILGIAGLDILFNPNPTHAGKAIQALFTGGGIAKLAEIIEIKLRQVFSNLFNSSWNKVLFIQIILAGLLYKFKKDEIIRVAEKYKNLFKGFKLIFFGSIAIFLFNDTGTIAAALIMTYLFIPMGMIMNKIE